MNFQSARTVGLIANLRRRNRKSRRHAGRAFGLWWKAANQLPDTLSDIGACAAELGRQVEFLTRQHHMVCGQ